MPNMLIELSAWNDNRKPKHHIVNLPDQTAAVRYAVGQAINRAYCFVDYEPGSWFLCGVRPPTWRGPGWAEAWNAVQRTIVTR